MNMFKPVNAKSVEEYIAMLNTERREIINALDSLIKATSPSLKQHFAYNMIGYGSFKYLDYKKREIDWPIVAVASQKNYVSVYVCALEEGEYLAEKYKDKLGKVSVGKSCIRFKKISDVNSETLSMIIKKASENPGIN
jgi:uncharacterized protein YdhG (YjbR/CyaY superfamily)